MSITIVTDVFGKTPALIALAKALNAKEIIDPYHGQEMAFNNESDAYNYFSEHVGLDVYLMQLTKSVLSQSSAQTLIGFSVGASAIWKLSATISTNYVKSAVCYYGSQIRNYTEITPLFPVKMIFPKHEAHFDVLALQKKLATKAKVNVVKTNYLHGFMNYHSNNYNHAAYQEHLNLLRLSLS